MKVIKVYSTKQSRPMLLPDLQVQLRRTCDHLPLPRSPLVPICIKMVHSFSEYHGQVWPVSASVTFIFNFLTSKIDRFISLPHTPFKEICSTIRSFVFQKKLCSQLWWCTNGQKVGRTATLIPLCPCQYRLAEGGIKMLNHIRHTSWNNVFKAVINVQNKI